MDRASRCLASTPARLCSPVIARAWAGSATVTTAPEAPFARGTPGTVKVRLGLAGGVVVHDQSDAVDVDAAGGDVSGDDDLGSPGAEPVAGCARAPAGTGRRAGRRPIRRRPRGPRASLVAAALRAGEDDAARIGPHQLRSSTSSFRWAPTTRTWWSIVGDRPRVGVDLVPGRVGQVPTDQPVDVTVERRREQQSLAARRRGGEQV